MVNLIDIEKENSSNLESEEEKGSSEGSLLKGEKNTSGTDVWCDQCDKEIGDSRLAWFSDRDKDLDFCSEECYSEWNNKEDENKQLLKAKNQIPLPPDITFAPEKWLTDQEIDWALSHLSLPNNYKVLPAHQFHYVSQTRHTTEAQAYLAFPQLLSDLNSGAELIFIPVSNASAENDYQGTHWSLLVYKAATKTFYHYDTLNGVNDEYVQPLVKELLLAQGVSEQVWAEHLIPQHEVQQTNGADCGIYLLGLVKRISKDPSLLRSKMTKIDPERERDYWRYKIEWLLECINSGEKIDIATKAEVYDVINDWFKSERDDIICKTLNFSDKKIVKKWYEENRDWQEELVVKLTLEELAKQGFADSEALEGSDLWGVCPECQQPNTSERWCQSCNAQHFQNKFSTWTSGKQEIDEFIQKYQLEAAHYWKILEWIPYEQFNNVEYLATGGFGKVYRADRKAGAITNWDDKNKRWQRDKDKRLVVLKNLHDSQNITADFLKEVINHQRFNDSDFIVKCYGISQNPQTGNYIMVMEMKGLNLRQYLEKNSKNLSFKNKFDHLTGIAYQLFTIHKKGLMHRDFHPGNMLSDEYFDYIYWWITDLGLCRSANETDKEKTYGVLPYVAPEALQKGEYTQASDVYSLGMVAYELFSAFPPYYNVAYNEFLITKVCQGLRPSLEEATVPQLLKELIKRCWDANPKERPSANEVWHNLWKWCEIIDEQKKDNEFYHQYKEVEKEHDQQVQDEIYPLINVTSKLLYSSKDLPKPTNNPSQQWQTTTLLDLQIKAIKGEIKTFKESLANEELTSLAEEFIQTNQALKRDENNEELMEQVGALHEELAAKGLSETDLEKLIYWSERLVELEQQLENQELQAQVEVLTQN